MGSKPRSIDAPFVALIKAMGNRENRSVEEAEMQVLGILGDINELICGLSRSRVEIRLYDEIIVLERLCEGRGRINFWNYFLFSHAARNRWIEAAFREIDRHRRLATTSSVYVSGIRHVS